MNYMKFSHYESLCKNLQIDKKIVNRPKSSKNFRGKSPEFSKLLNEFSSIRNENQTSITFKSFDDDGRKIKEILNQTRIMKPQSKYRNASN